MKREKKTALSDPLSEVTRKERKYLLAYSVISIAIVLTGLIPTEITALGISFDQTNQIYILIIFMLLVIYYLASFLSSLYYEFSTWIIQVDDEMKALAAHNYLARVDFKGDFEKEIEKVVSEMNKYIIYKGFILSFITGSPHRYGKYARHEKKWSHSLKWAQKHTYTVTLSRKIFDFYLPVIVGLLAITFLLIEIIELATQ